VHVVIADMVPVVGFPFFTVHVLSLYACFEVVAEPSELTVAVMTYDVDWATPLT